MNKQSHPPSGIDLPALVADLERATEAWEARQSPPMPRWAEVAIWLWCVFVMAASIVTVLVWLLP